MAFADYLRFIKTLPVVNDAVRENFKLIISQIKLQSVGSFWKVLLEAKLNNQFGDLVLA